MTKQYTMVWATLQERQNGRHFADDVFRRIFVNEKFFILISILLKFVPKGPIDNKPELVERTAWRRLGDKPLTHICITRKE